MSARLRSLLLVCLLVSGLLPVAVLPVYGATPGAPTLLEPADGTTVTATGVHFHWSRVPGAVSYRLHAWAPEAPAFDFVEVTANDDLVATVSVPSRMIEWTVTPIDAEGVEGTASETSTFTSSDPAPMPLGPDGGAQLTYPEDAVNLRPWWPEGWTAWSYLDTDLAGSTGPLPALRADLQLRLEPGSYRWTAGGPFWSSYGSPVVAAPVRTFTLAWRDAEPSLVAPADGTTVAPGDSVTLRWDPVPGAVAYEVQLDEGAGWDASPQSIFGTSARAYVVSGLWSGKTIRWRIRATQTPPGFLWPVRGPWSSARTFAVSDPVAPTGLSPADGATLTAWPVFRWDPVPGAAAYHVEFASDALGTGSAGRTVVTPATTLMAASWWETPRAPGTSGSTWWRVRAESSIGGVDTAWTPWRQVVVAAPGGALQGPADATPSGSAACATGATCDTLPGRPILRWAAVPGAALYRLFMHADPMPEGTWDSVDVAGTAYVPRGLAATVLEPSVARMTWAVAACPSAADCPTEPLGASVHFAAALPAPALVSPATDTGTPLGSVVLTWNRIGATSADPDVVVPAAPLSCVESVRTRADGFATTSSACVSATALVLSGLTDDETVSWRVQASAGPLADHEPAAWSVARTVAHHEPGVVLESPAVGAVLGATPVLRWQATGTEAQFGVQLLPADVVAQSGWLPLPGWHWEPAGATSVQPVTDLAPGDYVWRVWQNDGEPTVGSFTIAGSSELQLIAPAPGAEVPADDVDLSWAPVPFAREYTVSIGSSPDYGNADAVWSGYSRLPAIAVPLRLPEGPLYWRVCPVLTGFEFPDCSATSSLAVGGSQVRTLSVTAAISTLDIAEPVSKVTAIVPRAGSALSPASEVVVDASWTASDLGTGIDDQEVQLQRDDGEWGPVGSGLAASGVRSVGLRLAPGHTYRFRTRATDLAGNVGAWSMQVVETRLRQETSGAWTRSRGWTRIEVPTASGGAFRRSALRWASMATAVYARSIAIVAPRSATRGSAEVWLDGRKVAVIRLNAAPTGARRLVFTHTWSSLASHRIRVVVLGTAGHPAVDVDALVVLR
jgi:hypothetical protein